jgi:hypothetical protein
MRQLESFEELWWLGPENLIFAELEVGDDKRLIGGFSFRVDSREAAAMPAPEGLNYIQAGSTPDQNSVFISIFRGRNEGIVNLCVRKPDFGNHKFFLLQPDGWRLLWQSLMSSHISRQQVDDEHLQRLLTTITGDNQFLMNVKALHTKNLGEL